MPPALTGESTRGRILETAFQEFYRNGFQGGSLNRIVGDAETTKGALFHHFDGKKTLGLAIVDEVLYPQVCGDWVAPLSRSVDPIKDIKTILRRKSRECCLESIACGCPLNNLAQEMSPLDEEFRRRLERVYATWRDAIRGAFERGLKAGKVKSTVKPVRVAAFLVAAFSGMVGTTKNAQSLALMKEAGAALMDYLDSLKP